MNGVVAHGAEGDRFCSVFHCPWRALGGGEVQGVEDLTDVKEPKSSRSFERCSCRALTLGPQQNLGCADMLGRLAIFFQDVHPDR